jgi:hypothetical protein
VKVVQSNATIFDEHCIYMASITAAVKRHPSGSSMWAGRVP